MVLIRSFVTRTSVWRASRTVSSAATATGALAVARQQEPDWPAVRAATVIIPTITARGGTQTTAAAQPVRFSTDVTKIADTVNAVITADKAPTAVFPFNRQLPLL